MFEIYFHSCFQTQQSLSLTGDEESCGTKEKTTETPTETEKESLTNNVTENKDQVNILHFWPKN